MRTTRVRCGLVALVCLGAGLSGCAAAHSVDADPHGASAVVVDPLRSSDALQRALPGCTSLRARTAGQTSDAMLLSQCSGVTQNLGISALSNTAPSVRSIEVQWNGKLCSDQAARIRVSAEDVDGDAISYEWTGDWPLDASEAGFGRSMCLSRGQSEAVFSAIVPGSYGLRLRLSDGRGGETSLSIPIVVADCASQELTPVCAGVATKQLLGDAPIQNPIGCDPCGGFDHDPPYPLWPRSVMLIYRTATAPEATTACPTSADGTWTGTYSKEVVCPTDTDACDDGCDSTTQACEYEAACAYQYTGVGVPHYDSLAALRPASGTPKLLLDQPILGVSAYPSAIPLEDATWLALQARFRAKIDFANPTKAFSPTSAPAIPQSISAANLTRVAVVDSAAVRYDELGDIDTFAHGRAVGRIIADLSCHDDAILQLRQSVPFDPARLDRRVTQDFTRCANVIHNYLALDQLAIGVKDPHGGYFGDLATLDVAINHAIGDWIAVPVSVRPHLVINLSLGWDERHERRKATRLESNSGSAFSVAQVNGESSMGAQIKRSLQRASCLGAIVIAAAGNADLEGDVNPTYPAAWENTLAPNESQCAKLGFLYDDWPSKPPSDTLSACHPLVYAVSAVGDRVTSNDVLLATARVGGTARTAAQGLSAITSEWRTGLPPYTAVLSGSSMAAAVVSGSLALQWSLQPELDGHAIMAQLRQDYRAMTATDVATASPDHTLQCFSADTYVIHQCRALLPSFPHDPLGASPTYCQGASAPTVVVPQLLPASQPIMFNTTAEFAPIAAAPIDAPPYLPTYSAGLTPWLGIATLGLSSQPTVGPQPGSDPCPTCSMQAGSATLTGALQLVDENKNPISGGYAILQVYLIAATKDGTYIAKLFDQNSSNPPPAVGATFSVQLSGLTVSSGLPISLLTVISLGNQFFAAAKALQVN
jgi:subtilisin family serine protease